ncbi:thioesterase domain-containing protein [Nocardia fluminea]|uniref:thioesterase domain-containing protein n=1 Tax=Nocardia fluminea TaxID=134984 RepID=UPI001472E71F|nr:thioesterase domain-containing protein [Nocardia fluminea]
MSSRDDPADLSSACEWTAGRPDSCSADPAVGARAESAATSIVLPIRPRSTWVDGVPLFCLAGEAVLAWNYVGLVAHLDPRVPVYGLQASAEPRTIRDYATRYLAEIRRIAPQGPYQLLGWSAGGFVAHEVAVRLRAAGERVRVVVLATDPEAHAPAPLPADRLVPCPGAGNPAAVGDTTTSAADAAAAINAATAGTVDVTGADLDRLAALSATAARMVRGHRPAWLPGDLTVCIPGRASGGADRLDPGATVRRWRPYVEGAVTGFVLDATPDELTAPDVLPEIARILGTAPLAARTTC